MRGLAEAIRAAGNVFLTPVRLSDAPGARKWRRALLAGSRDPGVIGRAGAELGKAAPGIAVDLLGEPRPSAREGGAARGRRYDVACLLLTGEGRYREKLAGLRSRARFTLAYGAAGQWYRVVLPPFSPLRPRWWARAVLAAMLCEVYKKVGMLIVGWDALRRLAPAARPVRDPGPPKGRQVTFVVPTHDQRQLMDFCLPPLLAEAGDEHRVLVVDDASSDGTAEYVREHYSQVQVVRLERNRGFAGAVKAGIAASSTPLFALINTDVQVRPGFLRAVLPHFDEADTFAVCSRIELPGGSGMETGNVAASFSGIIEPYHVAPAEAGPILYAGGASSVFHRARYEALGGIETIYRPLYWEDIELGYRAWRRGWRSVFEPEASVFHKRRAWMGKRFGDAYANETFLKNALVFTWKNVRDRGLLLQHFAYVWARLVREVMSGEGMMCRALLRALPMLGWVSMKRWAAHSRGDLGDREILERAAPRAALGPADARREEDASR